MAFESYIYPNVRKLLTFSQGKRFRIFRITN